MAVTCYVKLGSHPVDRIVLSRKPAVGERVLYRWQKGTPGRFTQETRNWTHGRCWQIGALPGGETLYFVERT